MRWRPNRWQFAARKPFTGRQRAIAHPCLWYCGAVALLWALVTLWGRVHNASIRVVARLCSNGAAFVSRLFPIPLSEWLVFLAVAALVALPVWGAVRRGKRGLAKGLCRSLALLLTIGLWFSLFWGVNYDAAPLAQQLGLEVKPRSVDELYAAAQTLLEDANRLADQVERDGGGDCAAGDFSAMSQDLWEDYQTLGQQAPLYRSAVARRPKQALVLGPLMPWVGIAGYYFPFSTEPVVGPTVPHPYGL